MLFNNAWYMDKSEAQERVLTVDDSAQTICQECWIYGEEVDVIDSNGNYCGVRWQETKGVFEELVVPPCVVTVEERAFYRHGALQKLSILENVTEIGKEAFKGCDGLAFVVAPKVSLSSVSDPESKMKLATGFLINKELYTEAIAQEHEAYIKKQKNKLLQANFFPRRRSQTLFAPTPCHRQRVLFPVFPLFPRHRRRSGKRVKT